MIAILIIKEIERLQKQAQNRYHQQGDKKTKRKEYYENNEERLWDQTPNKQTELSNKEKDKKESMEEINTGKCWKKDKN